MIAVIVLLLSPPGENAEERLVTGFLLPDGRLDVPRFAGAASARVSADDSSAAGRFFASA